MRIGLVLPSIPAYSETFFTNKIKGLEAHGHTVVIFVNNSKKGTFNTSKCKVAPKLSGSLFQVGSISMFKLIYSFVFHFKKSKRLYLLDRKDGLGLFQRIKNIIGNSHIITEPLDWLHFGFGTMVFNRENVAKAIGAKMAVSFRGFDIGVYPLKNPGCYLRLWDKVDKIHVISNDISALLYKHGYNGKAEIIKITPAIDTFYFNNEEHQLPSVKNSFITVARLHWKKGLEYTLEAFALLKKEGINFHYTIIGEGEEYERLKFAAYQLDLLDYVTFTGKIDHEKIKDELNNANIYIQYSIQEGFCNAVLEAQAMGKLCIVSNAEGLSENVLDNETGWVVPKCNPKALAEKIQEVLALSVEQKSSITQTAQKRVREEFNLEKQQQEFVGFYK
ncbi:MAG: glycosyltransferase family 4 protein [Flavobacteriaceae bacterium]|nr:glycosyltransferase family 4 protein [Flavobacteriaceae bacterium]